jgi:hypothetical protein
VSGRKPTLKKIYYLYSLIVFSSFLLAGTTGKISGRVTASETNAPLAGVNIQYQVLFLGAASDENGYYVYSMYPRTPYSKSHYGLVTPS